MERFTGDFSCREDLIKNFELGEHDLDQCLIVFAHYGGSGYDGCAFVIFQENGKLFEVNGSHCSCYGLEGQWSPEETSLEVLIHRIEHGNLGYDGNSFKDELLEALSYLEVTLDVGGGRKVKV